MSDNTKPEYKIEDQLESLALVTPIKIKEEDVNTHKVEPDGNNGSENLFNVLSMNQNQNSPNKLTNIQSKHSKPIEVQLSNLQQSIEEKKDQDDVIIHMTLNRSQSINNPPKSESYQLMALSQQKKRKLGKMQNNIHTFINYK